MTKDEFRKMFNAMLEENGGIIYGHASTRDAICYAIRQEREACAKVCDEVESRADALWNRHAYPEDQGMSMGASQCAAAIRARGTK